VVVGVVLDQLDRVHERIASRFARSEPRARAREYVSGLVAGLERKNGWTLAEQAGEISPDGMQRLLRWADWDIDGVRDDLRGYVIEHLGEPSGVLIVDDTGFGEERQDVGGGAAAVLRHRRSDRETARSAPSWPMPALAGMLAVP
jgi:SRSO17 transposase